MTDNEGAPKPTTPPPATQQPAPPPQAAPAPPPPSRAPTSQPVAAARREVYLWGHTNVLHWWIVWLTGFVCAGLTLFDGQATTIGEATALVHPSPFVGATFLGVLLFVLVFTAFKVRSYIVAIVALLGVVGALLLSQFEMLNMIFGEFKLPVVYLSFGFYIIMSSVTFVVWAVSVFLIDPCTNYKFSPGYMVERYLLEHRTEVTHNTLHLQLRKNPVDFMRIVLGLGQTADVEIIIGDYRERVLNVWGARRKVAQILALRDMSQPSSRGFGG